MKTVKVTLRGISPLLINRYDLNGFMTKSKSRKASGSGDARTPDEIAKSKAYSDANGHLYIPSSWVIGSLLGAASAYKHRATRKSLKSLVGGAVLPASDRIYLDGKRTLDDVETDLRPVVIQRARVPGIRAKLSEWAITFELEIDDSLISPDEVEGCYTDAGRRIGIGDYRPAKSGPFGRYIVDNFKVL